MTALLACCCAPRPAGLEKSVTATDKVVSLLAGSRQATLALPLHVAEQRVADDHADGPEKDGHGNPDRQVVPIESLLQGHHVQDARGVAGAAAGGAVDRVEDVERVDAPEEADNDEVRDEQRQR